MRSIFGGLKVCGKKITSASKFIDYFVHDILDYTILNKKEKNFTKDLSVFDIRETLKQIIEIQEDKATMKNIKIRLLFKGFESLPHNKTRNFWVKSDQKRLQQVLLNLYSNALKFTDRNGKITIIVEKTQEIHDPVTSYLRLSVIDTGLGIK